MIWLGIGIGVAATLATVTGWVLWVFRDWEL